MSPKRKSVDSHSADMSSIESVGEIDLLNSIASAGKYIFDQKMGERIWLSSTTSTLYSTFLSDSSQTSRAFIFPSKILAFFLIL